MKNILIVCSLLILLASTACQNDDCSGPMAVPPLEDILAEGFGSEAAAVYRINVDTKGDFIHLKTSKVFGMEPSESRSAIAYVMRSTEYANESGNLIIDGIQITDSDENGVPQFYPKEKSDLLVNSFGGMRGFQQMSRNNEELLIDTTLYFPEDIFVNSPKPVGGSSAIFAANTTVNWNADPNNERVYFLIYVEPDFLTNDAYNLSHPYYNVVTTEDDGSYTFSHQDFGNLPPGVVFYISLVRGSYLLVDDLQNNRTQLILATPSTFAYFTLEEAAE